MKLDFKGKHFVVHKPYGMLSQFKPDPKSKRRSLLSELYEFPEGTMAVGRLDAKSEGLLLLTSDGKLSEWVRSRKVEKEYYVQVDGLISEEAINKLRAGVDIGIDGSTYSTLPSRAGIIEEPLFESRTRKLRDDRHGPTSWISIVLKEGKFKQVRKMTASVGFPTLRLVRVRIGNYWLGELKSGMVQELDATQLHTMLDL